MASAEDDSTISVEDRTKDVSKMPNSSPQISKVRPTQTLSSLPIEMSEMSKVQQTRGSVPSRYLSSPAEASGDGQPNQYPLSTQLPSEPSASSHAVNCEPLSTLPPNEPADIAMPSTSPLIRIKSGPAIGPATDKPSLVSKECEAEGPVLYITLLLTTGARHPFRLDQKYLKKRNVEVEGNNPANMSLYKLKELILRDWREGEDIVREHS